MAEPAEKALKQAAEAVTSFKGAMALAVSQLNIKMASDMAKTSDALKEIFKGSVAGKADKLPPVSAGIDLGSGDLNSMIPLLPMYFFDAVTSGEFDNQSEPAIMEALPKKGLAVTGIKIYQFGATTDALPNGVDAKATLGGKGAGLREMSLMGLPVPPGFIIPCEASVIYNGFQAANNGQMANAFMNKVMEHLIEADQKLRDQLGFYPLVSVRSGARVSMPGMMDTILNVGINNATLGEWSERIGKKAALDSYRRFLQMYGTTARGIPAEAFNSALEGIKQAAKVTKDSDLDENFLARLVKRYEEIYSVRNEKIPESREEALRDSIEAVFRSWNNDRAKEMRAVEGYPDDWGTAVTVQAMVFGNAGDDCCSGVAFTRDKKTGANEMQGDFLVNAQGEDVVAADAPTQPLDEMAKWNQKLSLQLGALAGQLENHFKDMQDIEFTVEHGKLWLLQTRTGKRSAKAAFKIAYDMVLDGLITKQEAMGRVSRKQLIALMTPQLDPDFKAAPIAVGLGVGGGVVTGMAALDCKSACELKEKGCKVILVRQQTDPDDLKGMLASEGILTATGGTTSHAAVNANGYNKACVVGCTAMVVTANAATFHDGKDGYRMIEKTEIISIDGATGRVWLGEVPVIAPEITPEALEVCGWFADKQYAHRLTPATLNEAHSLLVECRAGQVAYLDTCLLDMDADLSKLHESVTACKAHTVVFDLSHVDAAYNGADKAMNQMFGWDPMLGMGNKRAVRIMAFTKEAASKCVLKLPASCTMADKLRAKGFKVIGPVKTVADLLGSDGPAIIDEETILSVFGSKEALQWVQDAMGKAGKAPAKPLPEPAYWYEALMRKGA
jgi:phosphohistidine swiveling domain-containing protein